MYTCPNCQSNDIIVKETNSVKGFGFCKGILGYICFGPFGLLCGFLGFGQPKSRRQYIHCNNCGANTNVW